MKQKRQPAKGHLPSGHGKTTVVFMSHDSNRISFIVLVLLSSVILPSGMARSAKGNGIDVACGLLASLDPAVWSGEVVIKLWDDSGGVLAGHRIVDGQGQVLVDLHRHFPAAALGRVEQGFGLDIGSLRAMRSRATARCKCDLSDLTSYFSVKVTPGAVVLEDVLEGLLSNPIVELAYPAPDHALIPPPVDVAPTTPPFVDGQGYLLAAPDGIGAVHAWTLPGGRGDGIAVVDMEAGWDLDHEDLDSCVDATIEGIGTVDPTLGWDYTHHGTAVLGVLFGSEGGYGVTGIVPRALCHVAPDWTVEHYYSIPRAIVMSTEHLAGGPGVILLEAQTAGPRYDPDLDPQRGLVPVEWEPPVFDAIELAVASGIVVVEAAGNGSQDLDDTGIYADRFDRDARDSGAIIVGAGQPLSHAPEWYTNHGSRVDLHAWGSLVTTTGYGDLFRGGDDVHQFYTGQFAGTSSASPIVTGAVAAYLGVVLEATGAAPTPIEVRKALVDTGTGQTVPSRHIGPQPDLRRALGATLAICGDGVVHVDETCDDWNESGGDGCSADCLSDETCGNGFLDTALGEACDDGDLGAGDGCSANCLSDETCGNGIVDAVKDEGCDDGNLADGDGCSSLCTVEEEASGGGCGCSMTGHPDGAFRLVELLVLLSVASVVTRRRK